MTVVPELHLGQRGLDRLPSVDLETLVASADLQRRFDRKHLVGAHRLPELLTAFGDSFRVLEVSGRRSTDYTSVYFDTTDLRTYRDHLQQRRRRFKLRTRHYGDPATTMLELKCKGARGQTVKHRWPHPGPSPDRLGSEAEDLIARALDGQYGFALPEGLAPVVTTHFERVTLADLGAAERVTIDLGLSIDANGRHMSLGAAHAVVEIKSAQRRGIASQVMASLGLRPDPLSKYCIGVAASYEGVRGNPWLPVLRQFEGSPAPNPR